MKAFRFAVFQVQCNRRTNTHISARNTETRTAALLLFNVYIVVNNVFREFACLYLSEGKKNSTEDGRRCCYWSRSLVVHEDKVTVLDLGFALLRRFHVQGGFTDDPSLPR